MSDGEVYWKSGEWKEEITNDESSNWREAENVVVTLEKSVDSGMAEGAEVFLITDNAVFEGTYYKGYSVSKKLSRILLGLHEAAQRGGGDLACISCGRDEDEGIWSGLAVKRRSSRRNL